MKKDQVVVGGRYTVKVSGKVVPVEITEEKWSGDKHVGWVGKNTETGRPVRVKSAQRLRAVAGGKPGDPKGDGPVPQPQDAPEANVTPATAHEGETVAAAAGSPKPPRKGAKSPKGPKPEKGTKKAKPPKAPKEAKPKRVSALDAAAQVLAKAGKPMKAKELISEMESKGLWKSPGGRTPHATLYAAIIREIAAKGKGARFVKVDRGSFAAGKGA